VKPDNICEWIRARCACGRRPSLHTRYDCLAFYGKLERERSGIR
jgi:hypothetical protein